MAAYNVIIIRREAMLSLRRIMDLLYEAKKAFGYYSAETESVWMKSGAL